MLDINESGILLFGGLVGQHQDVEESEDEHAAEKEAVAFVAEAKIKSVVSVQEMMEHTEARCQHNKLNHQKRYIQKEKSRYFKWLDSSMHECYQDNSVEDTSAAHFFIVKAHHHFCCSEVCDNVREALAHLKEDDVGHDDPFVDLDENQHVTNKLLEVIQELEDAGQNWNNTLAVGLGLGDKVDGYEKLNQENIFHHVKLIK